MNLAHNSAFHPQSAFVASLNVLMMYSATFIKFPPFDESHYSTAAKQMITNESAGRGARGRRHGDARRSMYRPRSPPALRPARLQLNNDSHARDDELY